MQLFYIVLILFLFFTLVLASFSAKKDKCEEKYCVKLKDCDKCKHLNKPVVTRSELSKLKKIGCKGKNLVCCSENTNICLPKPNTYFLAIKDNPHTKYTELPDSCTNNMVTGGECMEEKYCTIPKDDWNAPITNCTRDEHICCPVEIYKKIDYNFNNASNCTNFSKCVNFRDCPTYEHLLDIVNIDEGNETIWKNQIKQCSVGKICCPIRDLQKKILPTVRDCKQTNQLIDKMSMGLSVEEGSFLWIANIYSQDDKFQCSGTLITMRHILTVAHCIYEKNYKLTYVTLGQNTTAIYDKIGIDDFIVHESFATKTSRNNKPYDIAVIRLKQLVDDKISPICLPAINWKFNNNTLAVIVGYNQNMSKLLQSSVELPELETCSGVYNPHAFCAKSLIYNEQPVENGDSGIPLSTRIMNENDGEYWVAIGIHLSAFQTKVVPATYLNVSIFLDWITRNLY